MAINTQKLLPSSTFKVSSNSVRVTNAETTSSQDKGIKKPLLNILKNVIKIESILKSTNNILKSKKEKDRKAFETKRFLGREKKLEEAKPKKSLNANLSQSPSLSLFDKLKRFLFFTFLGWLLKNYGKYLPQLIDLTKNLVPVYNFFESFTGNLFNGVVDFVGKGYEFHDRFREWTKSIGGEPFQKAFDGFTKNLNTFVNLAIVAGLLASGGTDFKKKGPKGKPGRFGNKPPSQRPVDEKLRKYLNRKSDVKNVERKFGKNAARYYEELKSSGKNSAQAFNEVKRKLGKKGLFNRQNVSGLAGKGRTAGKIGRRGLGKSIGRFGTKLFGKSGAKLAGKALGRIPIIGGLVDFLFSLWMGEKPGRAAAKAVGATIGSALGTFIPIPFAGTILGGILGDIVGGALYDTLIGNKKPKKKAVGGQVTRNGKQVDAPIRRTISKKIIPPVATKLLPGADVGGEEKLKTMFPEPELSQSGYYQDPFGFLNNASKKMSAIPFIGPMFSLFGKLILGQSLKTIDYKIIGLALTSWISDGVSKDQLQGRNINKLLEVLPSWFEMSSKKLIQNVASSIINELKENLALKPLREMFRGSELPPGELGDASDLVGGTKLLMDAGFPMKGAAYLSGNIQQESGWKGQRDPWVLNDGAGTNKGLVSWNRGRITNAEKFLGKPLNEATNAEQVRWIKHELEKSYPEAYKIFMNPDSSDAELERASYMYLGYGEVGARFKYAKEALKRVQKGETGTYKGVDSTISLGTNPDAALGSKIAGELGDFIKAASGLPYKEVHRHPKHLPWDPESGHSPGSLHYRSKGARAIDLGGYWPNDQKPILKKIEEFNRLKNVKPVQLFYGKPGTPEWESHTNHVHVAYKGGGTIGAPTDKNFSTLRTRPSYGTGTSVIFIKPVKEIVYVPINSKKSSGVMFSESNPTTDQKSTLFTR